MQEKTAPKGGFGVIFSVRVRFSLFQEREQHYTYEEQDTQIQMKSGLVHHIDTDEGTSGLRMVHEDGHLIVERYMEACETILENVKTCGECFPNRFEDLMEHFKERQKEF